MSIDHNAREQCRLLVERIEFLEKQFEKMIDREARLLDLIKLLTGVY